MTQVKEVGPFERMLTLTIDGDALAAGKKSAAARLSASTRIKGFRPGKAPVRVVESIVGTEALQREAIDDALPGVLAAAIAQTDLRPVVYPRLADVRPLESGAEVDVLITLWPHVERLPEYEGRRVSLERRLVSETDVDSHIERMRDQFAELDEVKREAFDGDYVAVDVRTAVGGEEVGAGSATDLMYEVGSGSLFAGMDEALRGTGTGGIVEFDTTLPEGMAEGGDRSARVRVLVKRVLAKRLPELTDEWVQDVSEYGSVAELRERLGDELQEAFDRDTRARLEQQLLGDLVEEMDLGLPEALVNAEMEAVLHRFAHRLERRGVELRQYLELTGQDEEQFAADLRAQADANLRVRILLDSVATAEGLEVTPDEVDREAAALAEAGGVDATEYRAALAEGGHDATLGGDILRRKAVDRLLELAVPVDESGVAVELPERQAADDPEVDEARNGSPDDGDRPTQAMEVEE